MVLIIVISTLSCCEIKFFYLITLLGFHSVLSTSIRIDQERTLSIFLGVYSIPFLTCKCQSRDPQKRIRILPRAY